ncbi:MAG TPA: NUDIX hydrolase [Candidatus Binatia bacterium]|nr:NUDIX hydrolase [Candidatus Binatia bacterium]
MRDVHVVVATLVQRDGRFLIVEERIDGGVVLNQPAGHWEPGETLEAAARRETLEETAWHVEPESLLGLYEYHPPDLPYGFLRVAFRARPLHAEAGRALDEGIVRAVWLTPDELRADASRHRSPMVMRCVEDALRGQSFPLGLVAHLG